MNAPFTQQTVTRITLKPADSGHRGCCDLRGFCHLRLWVGPRIWFWQESCRCSAGLGHGCSEWFHLWIIGPSGCGKATLLKVSFGFLSPESGVVSVPPDIPRSGVGYSPQEIALCRVIPDQAGHTFGSHAAGSQVRRGFHRPTQLVGLATPLLLSSNHWACTS